jgi:hypothetical protein
MTLSIETGAGLRGSNAYVTEAFVDAYLTELTREAENSWSTATTPEKEAAIIAASSYIDNRWGPRFKGVRQKYFNGLNAQAILSIDGVPTAEDTVTLGALTYIWKAALSTLGIDEVVIGATAAESADNLMAAINGNVGFGETYSANMIVNDSAVAGLEDGSTTSIILTAATMGTSGNDTALSESGTQTSVTVAFVNGTENAPQAMEFPRTGLYDQDGKLVVGIPLNLKKAASEYAIRQHSAELFLDPSVDESGRAIVAKKEKVGPIEEATEFTEGAALDYLVKPYPAADKLLTQYVFPAGVVLR